MKKPRSKALPASVRRLLDKIYGEVHGHLSVHDRLVKLLKEEQRIHACTRSARDTLETALVRERGRADQLAEELQRLQEPRKIVLDERPHSLRFSIADRGEIIYVTGSVKCVETIWVCQPGPGHVEEAKAKIKARLAGVLCCPLHRLIDVTEAMEGTP